MRDSNERKRLDMCEVEIMKLQEEIVILKQRLLHLEARVTMTEATEDV